MVKKHRDFIGDTYRRSNSENENDEEEGLINQYFGYSYIYKIKFLPQATG